MLIPQHRKFTEKRNPFLNQTNISILFSYQPYHNPGNSLVPYNPYEQDENYYPAFEQQFEQQFPANYENYPPGHHPTLMTDLVTGACYLHADFPVYYYPNNTVRNCLPIRTFFLALFTSLINQLRLVEVI